MSIVRFGDVVKEVKNNIDRKNNPYEFYIAGDHMDSEDLEIHRRGDFATDDVGPAFIREFKAGQVLYGSRRTYLKKVAVPDFDGVTANTTFVLETRDEKRLLQELLPFVLLSEGFTQWSIMKSKGSTNPYVLFSDLADYEFELPDLDKQRELTKVLWAMDATKRSYQKLLHKTDELVKAQFVEQFSDLVSDESKCATLEEICEVFSDGDWIESKDQSEDGIRLIQTGNVGNGIYLDKGEKARYISKETFIRLCCTEVKPKDILISRLPDPVGRACIIPEELGKCITAVDCTILRLRPKVLPEFFVAYTLTPLYTSQIDLLVTGSTRKRVSRKNLGKVIVPIPELASQEQFAVFVHQSKKSKLELEQAFAELNATYKKIISENLD